MKDRNEIGQKIRRIRKEQNLRISDLSVKAKKCSNKISDLENGKTDYKISTLIALLDALGYEIEITKKQP